MVQRTVTNMAEPALVEGIGFFQPTENPAQTFQHLKGAQRGEGSRNSTESLNHRILEYWGWKGPSFLHSKPSATGKDTFPRPGLNTGTAHPEKCPNNPHWRYSKLRFRGSQVTQPKVPSSLDFPSTLCSSASDFHFSAWDLLFICLWFFFFSACDLHPPKANLRYSANSEVHDQWTDWFFLVGCGWFLQTHGKGGCYPCTCPVNATATKKLHCHREFYVKYNPRHLWLEDEAFFFSNGKTPQTLSEIFKTFIC